MVVKQDASINLTCTRVEKKAQKKTSNQTLFGKWLNSFKIVTVCFVFFDNFFNSLSLIVKLYEKGLYGTARKDMKGMLEKHLDRKMKRADFGYWYSNIVARCKWLDRRSVKMLFSNVERMAATLLSFREKGNSGTFPRRCQNVQKKEWVVIREKGMD